MLISTIQKNSYTHLAAASTVGHCSFEEKKKKEKKNRNTIVLEPLEKGFYGFYNAQKI